ncbi:MAG: phosphoribosylaminoimidazolesuccinocarboxamide synthase [Ignavibacterium sp.]|uniref:phosphoribosylaminoimidazolesuccinocarboxamide synthase n=1 Tax=Ignavibacterium sp. TaxID=2651167 RepID=UPI00404A772E
MLETIFHTTPMDEKYIQVEYTDTVLSEKKKMKVKDIGQKTCELSHFFFEYATSFQIPTAYVKKDDKTILKFVNYKSFPFYVKILNRADKRIAKIFGLKEHSELKLPVFEFHYGKGKDTVITESHLISFDLCNYEEMKIILRISSKVNAVLKSFFDRRNEILSQLSCTFGKFEEKIYLTGDFSPFGLKIYPKEENKKWTDPEKMITAAEIKKYTEFLYNIVSPK